MKMTHKICSALVGAVTLTLFGSAIAQTSGVRLGGTAVYDCDAPRIVDGGVEVELPTSSAQSVSVAGSTLNYRCDERIQRSRWSHVIKTSNRSYSCPTGTTDILVTKPTRRWQTKGFHASCYGIPPHASNTDLGDAFYSHRVCSQPLINKFWHDFDFDKGDWDQGLGYYHVCDIERPLNRTFSALWALLYSTPTPPGSSQDVGGDILRWGYNYSAREIDELDGSMATDALATTKHGCFIFCDNKTVLKRGFFYNQGVPERAGTVVHEARHADGKSHSSCSCPRGASCDSEWPANHADWHRYGANVYQVLYLWLFADTAVNTTPPMQRRALQRANQIVNGGFCRHPGFNIVSQPQYRVRLRASNRQYLVAEGGGGGAINANQDYPKQWETFALVDTNGGALKSGDPVHLRTYDGHYVVAEGSGGGIVQANRNIPASWETFVIRRVGGHGTIDHGDVISLQAASGHFVVAEGGGGGTVNANRSQVGPWEQFTLQWQGGRNLEFDVDRPGSDYHSLSLPEADAALCQRACQDDQPLCRAWTYVNPGYQGDQARCWLKHEVPPAQTNSCCVSGLP